MVPPTIIANLIFRANTPTPDFIIHFFVSCLRHLSTGLTKRKLPMRHTISMKTYGQEAWKSNRACRCTYRQMSGIQELSLNWFLLYSFNLFYFILVTYMKQLDYCRIVRTKREELKKMYVISKNDRAGTQKCSLKKAFSKIS